MTESLPSFLTRVLLAWITGWRILFDGRYAARIQALAKAAPSPIPGEKAPPPAPPASTPTPAPAATGDRVSSDSEGALLLLELLQDEGRFIDFVRQDLAHFDDATIGVAARAVHEGCRRALERHATLAPVHSSPEGALITVDEEEVGAGAVKLTGQVSGKGPWRGRLVHPGWRVDSLSLPVRLANRDARVITPAEVEL